MKLKKVLEPLSAQQSIKNCISLFLYRFFIYLKYTVL